MHRTFSPGETVFIPYPDTIIERTVFALAIEGNSTFRPPPGQPHYLCGADRPIVAEWAHSMFRTRTGAEFRRLLDESIGHISPWDAVS